MIYQALLIHHSLSGTSYSIRHKQWITIDLTEVSEKMDE